MGMFDFEFLKSKTQIEKEKKEFENKIFPFGLEQRNYASQLLEEIIDAPKIKINERLFIFISSKDKYLSEEEPELMLNVAERSLKGQSWLPKKYHKIILAMVILESDIDALESYPTADQVRAKAENL